MSLSKRSLEPDRDLNKIAKCMERSQKPKYYFLFFSSFLVVWNPKSLNLIG